MDNSEIRYPIGVQSFEEVRSNGYLYVDKTGYIARLLKNKYYFLGRPRRFGKSLLLSTLEAYFKGKKELFEGLEVSKTEKNWVEYPVIHIDFASMRADSSKELSEQLLLQLEDIAASYGLDIPPERRKIELAFGFMLSRLNAKYGKNVVVLIDEYDKGIIEVLHDQKLMDDAITTLRPFFSVPKSHDRHIKFAFVTGVSRFRNTTIFSGNNNLKDISMSEDYAAICGITRDELLAYFGAGIDRIARKFGYTAEKTVEAILQKYDGYRFTSKEEYVCNPFSVLNALDDRSLDNYWVMSGSSRILVDFMHKSRVTWEKLTDKFIRKERLEGIYSVENPAALFFQTGYLTVAEWDGGTRYRLKVPNEEVQTAMTMLFMPEYTRYTPDEIDDCLSDLRFAVYGGDSDGMMRLLQAIVSSIPYHEIVKTPHESHLHLCMHVIFMMLGASTHCEIATPAGRADMVVETPWRVYVFEFKLDESPSAALRQIDDRGYAIQWEARDRKVTKIGVEYSSKKRTIVGWDIR